jgi:hypothetical protein
MISACRNPRNGDVLQPPGEPQIQNRLALSQDLSQTCWRVRICGVAHVGSLDCLGSSASHGFWFSPSASRWTSQQPHVFEEKASP